MQLPISPPIDALDVHDLLDVAKWLIGIFVTILLAQAAAITTLWNALHSQDTAQNKRADDGDAKIWDTIDKNLRPVTATLTTRVAVLEAMSAARASVVDSHATKLLNAPHPRANGMLEAMENNGADSLPTRDLDELRVSADTVIADPAATPSDIAAATQLLSRIKSTLIVREQFYGGAVGTPAPIGREE